MDDPDTVRHARLPRNTGDTAESTLCGMQIDYNKGSLTFQDIVNHLQAECFTEDVFEGNDNAKAFQWKAALNEYWSRSNLDHRQLCAGSTAPQLPGKTWNKVTMDQLDHVRSTAPEKLPYQMPTIFFCSQAVGSCNLVLLVHRSEMGKRKSIQYSRIGATPILQVKQVKRPGMIELSMYWIVRNTTTNNRAGPARNPGTPWPGARRHGKENKDHHKARSIGQKDKRHLLYCIAP